MREHDIDKIKTKDLNKFKEQFDYDLLMDDNFWRFYKKAMENESAERNKKTNRMIIIWTWIDGISALISAIGTIVSILIALYGKHL